jgi:hypothetical protein
MPLLPETSGRRIETAARLLSCYPDPPLASTCRVIEYSFRSREWSSTSREPICDPSYIPVHHGCTAARCRHWPQSLCSWFQSRIMTASSPDEERIISKRCLFMRARGALAERTLLEAPTSFCREDTIHQKPARNTRNNAGTSTQYTVHSPPSPPPTQSKQRSRLEAAVNVVTIHDPLPGRFFSTLNLRLTPGPRTFRRSSKTSPIPHQPTMPYFLLIRPA